MTRHRRKEEWIAQILEAARLEIDEKGYAGLSMEGIVRRTGLSKGGIYRFFRNRSDVALEVFAEAYRTVLHFEVADCLAWEVPLQETVFRLFARYSSPEDSAHMADRVWLRLLPQVLSDDRFKQTRADLLDEIARNMLALTEAVARRDGLQLPDDLAQRVPDAMALGVGLLEGFAVQSAIGGSIEHQAVLVRRFVTDIVHELLSV